MTNYTADLKQALHDLLTMASEKEQLETKIAKQKKRVAALYELVLTDADAGPIPSLVEGITDACRVVLRAAEQPLTPADIRDKVQALGLPPQANLLASIHTTLKRMKTAGELQETTARVGPAGEETVAYRWAEQKMIRLSALLNPNLIDLDPANLPGNVRAILYPESSGPEIGKDNPLNKLKAKRPQERFSLDHTRPTKRSE